MSENLMRNDLTTKEVVGTADENSPVGQECLKDFSLAQAALARSDAQELFVLYQKAIRQRNEIVGAMETIVGHFMGKNKDPRLSSVELPDSVAAMREVALSALALAKSLVENQGRNGSQRESL